MQGVTKEQITQAKEWDLLSYLQRYEPVELKKCGRSEYCTKSHDSLKISNGKWHWHSQGIGGRTALDYLIKVRGMEFVDAVLLLCGESVGDIAQKPITGSRQAQKLFLLPPANRCGTAFVSYLLGRGIDGEIINHCIGAEILYESRPYHNCVFVGRDPEGKIRYAFQRGTCGEYKNDVEGSDKRYGFCLAACSAACGKVTVTESPVDALSVATLRKINGEDWRDSYYLSLGGTAPCALLQFLKDHKAVTYIRMCLDNDRAGILGMEKIREAIRADGELEGRIRMIEDCPPPVSGGKDYNQMLMGEREANRCAAPRPAREI
ncbi:MAG: DUF3991 and toprim domain-containing protein [Lachnospiraceae bacterium]|nr:DUF3991 and toprim domain-containing protein [Lachnospiraceae bacterium]MCM1192452.1 DUF3991 and toprim domain-containing protein [Acetatifactor muris]